MVHCGFIGLGLIGGSIARALKQNRTDIFITAYDPNQQTRDAAVSQGAADEAVDRIDERFGGCDFIFLCAPVSCNAENLQKVLPFKKEECILTDVGSVKLPIQRKIESLGLTHCFIGGHPMAGSERIGFPSSRASLLENAYYIIAPAANVAQSRVQEFYELVHATGAIPLLVSPQEHDYVTAAVSHLPHLVASSLVNLIRQSDENGMMKAIAAGGFKDITRIASASPVMWQQICLTNKENISKLLAHYIAMLQELKCQLDKKDADALYSFFDSARNYRDSFVDAGSGPIKKAYVLRVDIPDQTGSIAIVAALLAFAGISIKNMGITHNREAEEGVLHIEFYEENCVEAAAHLLRERGYIIHCNG